MYFVQGEKNFLIDLKYSYRSVAVWSGIHFKPTHLQSEKKKIPAFHMFLTVFFVSQYFLAKWKNVMCLLRDKNTEEKEEPLKKLWSLFTTHNDKTFPPEVPGRIHQWYFLI